MTTFTNKGFGRKRESAHSERIPPGQHETSGFPVLSAGPTPRIPLEKWTFDLGGLVEAPMQWTWEKFNELPQQFFTKDIHCVTKWSKLDTTWKGVSVDTLLEHVTLKPEARYVMAYSYGGYTTNIPLDDLRHGKAIVALRYDGRPLTPEHGGPARLVVPHLYFWKSAKWIKGFRFMANNEPGFWETNGYSLHGDPWREQSARAGARKPQRYRSDD